jgi:tetratricopeptide (TPR) repeat protein
MDLDLDSKVIQIVESERTSKHYKQSSSSQYPSNSDDQDEEAVTYGFSWNVAEVMSGINTTKESNRFSQNPAQVTLMASCYLSSSDMYATFCPLRLGTMTTDNEDRNVDYSKLLIIQNAKWGEQKVIEGINAAKVGNYETAIELCNAALNFLPDSVEAFVCRGASYANINKHEKAVKDFEMALQLDPLNQNANQYLKKIKGKDQRVSTPNSIILPVKETETRPSKDKFSFSTRDLILKLGSSTNSALSSVISSDNNSYDRTVGAIATVNGYTFERENNEISASRHIRDESSSDTNSIRSRSTKKRKREKKEKHTKSSSKKKEKKKKEKTHKDRKK